MRGATPHGLLLDERGRDVGGGGREECGRLMMALTAREERRPHVRRGLIAGPDVCPSSFSLCGHHGSG